MDQAFPSIFDTASKQKFDEVNINMHGLDTGLLGCDVLLRLNGQPFNMYVTSQCNK